MKALRIAVPTYKRFDFFMKNTVPLLKRSPSLIEHVRVFIQCQDDFVQFRAAKRNGTIPKEIQLVRARAHNMWVSGYANIMNYIRFHFQEYTPIFFLHDDIHTLYEYGETYASRRQVPLSRVITLALKVSKGAKGAIVGFSPTCGFMPRSSTSNALQFVYDPFHLEINSRKLPLCHFKLKCDYETSLLSYILDFPIYRIGIFCSNARHTPYATKDSGGNQTRKQSQELQEAVIMKEVFKPLISSFKMAKSGFSTIRFLRRDIPEQNKIEIQEKYAKEARLSVFGDSK